MSDIQSCVQIEAEKSDATVRILPRWTEEYAEPYRQLLADFGIDHKGIPAGRVYIEELLAEAEHCRGQHHMVFEVRSHWLEERWHPVLAAHGLVESSRLAPKEPLGPAPDFGWLYEPAEDEDDLYRPRNLAKELRAGSGIAYTESLFLRMEACGQGPLAIGADHISEYLYRQWQTGVFGIPTEAPARLGLDKLPEVPLPENGKPLWMFAGKRSPDADYLRNHLKAWGANVVCSETPLEAAQFASSHKELSGAVLHMSNVQAEFVTADILMRRGLGFLVVAYGGERPAGLELGGAVIRNPQAIEEIRAAMGSLPPRHLKGLDLTVSAVSTPETD